MGKVLSLRKMVILRREREVVRTTHVKSYNSIEIQFQMKRYNSNEICYIHKLQKIDLLQLTG